MIQGMPPTISLQVGGNPADAARARLFHQSVDRMMIKFAKGGAQPSVPHQLDLVEQVEWVAAPAVEPVDKSDDRHVAQPAHLEELLVCSSIPSAASSGITALSTVVSVRQVSSPKSW
jgi:hypothetical protein